MPAKLIKADFHGAMITGTIPGLSFFCFVGLTTCLEPLVKQCKNPCLMGLSGIVILETENVFKIVTRADQLKGKRSLNTNIFHLTSSSLHSHTEEELRVRVFCAPLRHHHGLSLELLPVLIHP